MIHVSVVIPAFNAAAFIETAVASATCQMPEGLEVIVVDDHSGDDTRARVERMAAADSRISLIPLAANGGPSVARNAGIAASHGTWIALLDADDSFLPGRLMTLMELAAAKGADLVADNLMLVDEQTGSTMPMIPSGALQAPCEIDLSEFIARNISPPGAPRQNYGFLKPLMRRAFLVEHAIKYDEAVRFAEDFALYVECLRAGACWWLHPTPMYSYCVRQSSLTDVQTTHDLDLLRQRLRRLLADVIKEGGDSLAALVRRRLRGVDRCYYYRGFTDELKAKRWLPALGYLFAARDSVALIGRESLHQLPLILRKTWRGGYRRTAHPPPDQNRTGAPARLSA